jgi:hypothetical protein
VERNPALLLFTPREAKRPLHRTMTIKESLNNYMDCIAGRGEIA